MIRAKFIYLLFVLLFNLKIAKAQSPISTEIKECFKTANVIKLHQICSPVMNWSMNNVRSTISKKDSKKMLENLFSNYKPIKFDYIHHGSAKSSLHYSIAKYRFKEGSFRIYIIVKRLKGVYLIDTLEFTQE